MPVTGVGAGQAAQRQQARHEAQIGAREAGPNQLVHLIEAGEMVQCLGRGVADPDSGQAEGNFGEGNEVKMVPYRCGFSVVQ